MNQQDLEGRFQQHGMNVDQQRHSKAIRDSALDLAELISWPVPDCRERSIALTSLEEAVMWANKAIARYGVQEDVAPQLNTPPQGL